jgi:ribosomal protein S12 methylthiotransferase
LVSLGCTKNLVDSEVIAGLLAKEGWRLTLKLDEAEAIIINTCAFIQDAKHESLETLLELAELKAKASCRMLVVAGCLPQREGRRLLSLIPEVDAVVGVEDFPKIGQILESLCQGQDGQRAWIRPPSSDHVAGAGLPRLRLTMPHTAYLKIAEGCDHPCSFCIIPHLRGAYRSRPVEEILQEAQALRDSGALEIILVAQDVTAYGTDGRSGARLPELLRRLARIEGLRWIRLLYGYPTKVSDELLEVMASEERVLPYLDVPIQHISDRILEAMKRAGGRRAIEAMIERVRGRLPHATLRTTVMVGFPGETEKEFQELVDFIRQAAFDRLGAFAFSPEPESPAAFMPDQVPEAEKQARLEELFRIQHQVVRAKHQALVGRTIEVLYDGFDPEDEEGMIARTAGMAPEVDGVVRVASAQASPGEMGLVEITGEEGFDLLARPKEG